LDDHRIAMMDGSSIAPVLAPHPVDSRPILCAREPRRVDGAAVFVISRVPLIPDNFAPGGMQSATFAGLVRVRPVDHAGRSSRRGKSARFARKENARPDADARQLQSALETLRMFGRAALESPKTRQSMDPVMLGHT